MLRTQGLDVFASEFVSYICPIPWNDGPSNPASRQKVFGSKDAVGQEERGWVGCESLGDADASRLDRIFGLIPRNAATQRLMHMCPSKCVCIGRVLSKRVDPRTIRQAHVQ